MNSGGSPAKKPIPNRGDEKELIPYSLEWIRKNAPWQWREKTGRDKNPPENDGMGQKDDARPIPSAGRMDGLPGTGSMLKGICQT